MPRFVILEHDHPQLHWDLMLQSGEVLRTWRLLAAPEEGCAKIPVEASFDHRLLYLDYEGPVSGNRGHVQRWDHGTYVIDHEEADRLCLQLDGQRLHGQVVLEKSAEGWLFRRE